MEALALSLPLFTGVRARLVLRSSNPLCRIASPLCGRRMANCPALRLIASTKYWRNEYRFTVVRTTGDDTGIGPFANGNVVGVGRRDRRLHCWVHTPPRKIRSRFCKYKHTSLHF